MASTKYTFSISADFPNHKIDSDRLTGEIHASAIITALDYINTSGDECDIWFKAILSQGDETILDGIVAAHSGEPIVPAPEYEVDSLGRQIVVAEQNLDGAMVNVVSHNFADKTTWWQQSTSVTDETLTDSGDGFNFGSVHTFWVDVTHGKFYLEDRIPSRSLYLPVIKVNGTTLQERAPFSESGGDFVLNYRTGVVTFATSQSGKTVTASYHYAGSSLFTVAPSSGKSLWVNDSEVQFSTDVVMTGTVNFQAWAYNPSNLPNKMPVTAITNYKTLRDFVDEAKGCYPQVPALGDGLRGIPVPHVVFPFLYSQAKELKSSLGVEIRVWITGDTEFGGHFGTATFYCTSKSET